MLAQHNEQHNLKEHTNFMKEKILKIIIHGFETKMSGAPK
jgi:esterase/lipase superfamily enzyme